MANLGRVYNTEGNNEMMGAGGKLPTGTYIVHITSSKWIDNAKKTGSMLLLEYTVLEGPQKGKKTANFLNLNHPSPNTVDFATQELNSICFACQRVGVSDSSELHNIPFIVDVEKYEDGQGRIYNKFTNYNKVSTQDEPLPDDEVINAQEHETVDVSKEYEKPKENVYQDAVKETVNRASKLPWED